MKAPGMSWVIPYMMVVDVKASLDFYKNAFGFKTLKAVEDEDGSIIHGEMGYNDLIMMVGKEGKYSDEMKTPKNSGQCSPISLYVYVDNVDEFHKEAVAKGAVSVGEPEDMFWGDRCCRLMDADGYVWCFGSYIDK